MRLALVAALGIGGLGIACSGDGGSAGQVTVRDSAGVEIVESTPPARESVDPWVIDSVPLFDIGADPSDPNQEWTQPSNPVRLADGRIAVAEPGTQEIRFFDESGDWIRNVGRKGEGPGEFTDLRELFLGPGDSLYAYEGGTGFVSVLDGEGRHARRVRIEFASQGRFAVFRGVFADGTWLVDGSKAAPPTTPGVQRSLSELFEYSAEGKPVDSIADASMPGWEVYGEPVENRGFRYLYMPFRRGSVAVVEGRRAYFGATERIDLRVYRGGAGIERIVRIVLPERPLTREMIERAVDRQIAGWGSRASAQDREEYRSKVMSVSYPAQLPAFDVLTIAANGDLWLREYVVESGDPIRYVVADSTGRFRAYAMGPARFTPSWIGDDRAIGLWRDEDDVPRVRAYRLSR